ncbi:ovostatin-like isoform X2 [Dendrobates tinctorius]|uniref:ovostatin-like isoform X2 n=1 Tax=Dendrobates tinctorius TaxID=92724 RepID=UPI003CC9E238
MHLTGISLSLALLCLIAGGRSEPQCAFSIPALLKSGELVKGCLEVKHHSQPVNVDIILEVDGVNHTIISQQFPVGDVFTCPEFQVPVILKPAPVFLTMNAVATNYNYAARRAVVVAPTGKVTLIQMEKSIYKPGEIVNFIVIALNNRLKMEEDYYPNIYITDPSGNRLYQWTKQSTEISTLALSLILPEDPEFGYYVINIERQSRNTVTKSFRVEEYVLPNIKVELTAPRSITILDKTMPYKVDAKYTYGQGVPGKVSMRVCRAPLNYYFGNACNRNPDGLCVSVTGELNSDGIFSGELDLTTFQLDRSGYTMALRMETVVTEEGSGIQTMETKAISITSQMGSVRFVPQNMERFFKIGLPFYVEAVAIDGAGNPLSDQIIELQVYGITVKNLTTDAKGKVQDYIDTSKLEQSVVNIQVIYKNSEQCYDANYIVPTYSNDYYSITRSYSRYGSFVQIEGPKEELQCEQTYELRVQYIIDQSSLEVGETSTNFSYMVMSRANIVDSGRVPVDLTTSLQGEFSITLVVNPDHVPALDVVVYNILKEEVVLHKINLKTEKCFRTKASLEFSVERAIPGSSIDLNVFSEQHSMCHVRIYDSSLLLLGQDQSLTPEMVYSSLQYNSLNGYYYEGYSVAPPEEPCIDSNKQIKVDGLYYSLVGFPDEGDTTQQLYDIGLLILTNTTLRKPTLCGQPSIFARPPFWDGGFMTTNAGVFTSMAESMVAPPADIGATTEIQSLRNNFPEVWFFDKVFIGESGKGYLPLVVPGTITEWKADTVCFDHSNGFGMSKDPANFTSFQEFFVSDFLPYSFVRGETLIVKVVISNYLNKCAKVRAALQPSSDYTVEALDEDSEKCVCSGQRASYSFSLEAISVGTVSVTITGETVYLGATCNGTADQDGVSYKDTIVRSIIIEPEGIHKEVTKSSLVCVNDTTEVIPISIIPPANSVNGSVSAKVTVIGDILGRAMVNPESLINDPTGCGEQNLGTLSPIALVLDYLELTGRLTEEARSKGIQYIGNGYRRQLRYRNSDGSFSAFSRGQSSSWLTLKVLETLLRIKKYYSVEDRILQGALVYLENLRDKTTGGFKPQGTLFNNGLRGGAEDEVSFTAAVVAFLLQTEYSATPTLLREAMNYLVTASQKEQSVYNKALLLYVFQVAGNEERSQALFSQLKEVQIEDEGTIHWERPSKPNKPTSYIFPARAASADLEISALILLALTTGKSPLADLDYISQVANWFPRQQNAQGSYSTTADTVAVLQALCSYGALVHQKYSNNTVVVKHGDDVVKEFTLNYDNQLLLQTQDLPLIHGGEHSMNVSGNGCVLLQTTVKFNIPVDEEDSAFLLSVYTPPESCVDGVAYTFPVHLNLSYNGLRNQSNMALISLSLPSGYKPEYQSLAQLRTIVPKVEEINNRVVVYLDSVSEEVMSLKLMLEMTARVQNYQPKPVLVWDYYEKEENGIAFVQHPCHIQ